ncbi:hypothetical protein KNHN1_39490 [Pseudomonas guariconensis]
MYKDHIVKTRATDNVAFMGTIAVVIFVVALFSGVGEGSLARLMGPIVLDLQAPLLRNIAVAATLSTTLVLNLFILGRFPLRAQIITGLV